jgi:hypothetical protein
MRFGIMTMQNEALEIGEGHGVCTASVFRTRIARKGECREYIFKPFAPFEYSRQLR